MSGVGRTGEGGGGYNLRSTALGGRVVAEVGGDGTRKRAFIYAAGEEVARVEGAALNWEHRHPATGGRWVSNPNGAGGMVTELDPLGANVGGESSYAELTPAEMMFVNQNAHYGSRAGDPTNLQSGCSVNGMELPCDVFLRMADDGVLGLRANHPGGPGTVELPLRPVAGGVVWVDTTEVGRGPEAEQEVGEDEVVRVEVRSRGFFLSFLPVGAASYGPAATNLTPLNPQATGQTQSNLTREQQAIQNAVQDTLALLSGNNRCSRFFQGSEVASYVLRLLGAELVRNGTRNVMDRPDLGISMTFGNPDRYYQNVGFRIPTATYVNRSGPFFRVDLNKRVGERPGYTYGSRGARILQILHELAHAIRRPEVRPALIVNSALAQLPPGGLSLR